MIVNDADDENEDRERNCDLGDEESVGMRRKFEENQSFSSFSLHNLFIGCGFGHYKGAYVKLKKIEKFFGKTCLYEFSPFIYI